LQRSRALSPSGGGAAMAFAVCCQKFSAEMYLAFTENNCFVQYVDEIAHYPKENTDFVAKLADIIINTR
jgi:hypothetical protein